jgi:hypothetical protein
MTVIDVAEVAKRNGLRIRGNDGRPSCSLPLWGDGRPTTTMHCGASLELEITQCIGETVTSLTGEIVANPSNPPIVVAVAYTFDTAVSVNDVTNSFRNSLELALLT